MDEIQDRSAFQTVRRLAIRLTDEFPSILYDGIHNTHKKE